VGYIYILSVSVICEISRASYRRVDDGRERAGVILRWIHTAFECFELNNLACLLGIMSALLNASVYRLNRTWEIVKTRDEQRYSQFERMLAVVSSDKNYVVMRATLRSLQPPILPYLGLCLQDLTFCDEGNRNSIMTASGVSVVSFEKRLAYASIIQDIMLYQSVGYDHLVAIPEIQRYLIRFQPLSTDKMYARSLIVEPRDRAGKGK
jgi:hypothetical protein